MTSVVLKNVSVHFPVYGASNRSVKNKLIRTATGGRVARDSADKVVVRALDKLDLELREGDRVGVCGHNGSGKSTLLKVIAGVYEPSSGTCEVRGRLSTMLNLFLGMDMEATGYENIFLRGKIIGMTAAEIETMTRDVIDFADLGEYMDVPLRAFSTGMSMRLGFAVSTAVPCDILLMDEWMSVGDAEFSVKANVRLNAFLDAAKILVLASHSEDVIRQNCNRLIRLDHGEIVSAETLG